MGTGEERRLTTRVDGDGVQAQDVLPSSRNIPKAAARALTRTRGHAASISRMSQFQGATQMTPTVRQLPARPWRGFKRMRPRVRDPDRLGSCASRSRHSRFDAFFCDHGGTAADARARTGCPARVGVYEESV